MEFSAISNIVLAGDVLDVGCGSGRFLSLFTPQRYRRFGVEYGGEAADMARKVIGEGRFYEGALLNAPFKDKQFDLIIFRGVLEHLPNPRQVLDKVCNLIKEGGCIFLTSMPNLECICAQVYRSYWTQHREFEHIVHFGKSHFRRYFKEHGFAEILDKELYWDTPYANPKEDILCVAEAVRISEKKEGLGIKKTSPAFWGNVMSMAFKKIRGKKVGSL
jgi:SAM-dependent methyltransferase